MAGTVRIGDEHAIVLTADEVDLLIEVLTKGHDDLRAFFHWFRRYDEDNWEPAQEAATKAHAMRHLGEKFERLKDVIDRHVLQIRTYAKVSPRQLRLAAKRKDKQP